MKRIFEGLLIFLVVLLSECLILAAFLLGLVVGIPVVILAIPIVALYAAIDIDGATELIKRYTDKKKNNDAKETVEVIKQFLNEKDN